MLAQSLNGTWEHIGSDRSAGVWVEDLACEANEWGPSAASFTLRRQPFQSWPDLGAFTPIDVEIDGVLCWSGRVKETPSRGGADRSITVSCEGWQFHLDDDLYERGYVYNDMSAWKDFRDEPGVQSQLGSGYACAQGRVINNGGVLTLMLPTATYTSADNVRIVFDAGPGQVVRRIVMKGATSNNFNGTVAFRGYMGPDVIGETEFLGSTPLTTMGATFTLAYNLNADSRFVTLVLNTFASLSSDAWVTFSSLQLFADQAYETGNASQLKASTVVADAVTRGTQLLSKDQSQIGTTGFSIPTFDPDGPQTPRQVWESVDAYHAWLKKVDVWRRPVYAALPSVPTFELGAWSAMADEDASANSGADIYNRVLLTGSAPDGSPVRALRSQAQQPTAVQAALSAPAPTNPSFDTNTTGWTALASTITRDTGTYDSSPASGRWDNTGASDALDRGDALITTFTGTFYAGIPYVLSVRMNQTTPDFNLNVEWGDQGAAQDFTYAAWGGMTTGWITRTVTWTPRANTTNVTLALNVSWNVNAGFVRIDSLAISAAKPTIVDRRGFNRTKQLTVGSAIPGDLTAANLIDDTWLGSHKTAAFRGVVPLTGGMAVRDFRTGANVPLERLLLHTSELVRFSDRLDPDTGGLGRDGRMVDVKYTLASDSAELTIDNSRASFEALMNRYNLLTG